MKSFKCYYTIGAEENAKEESFIIDENDVIDEVNTDIDAISLFDDLMWNDFQHKVAPYSINKKEFIEWAKKVRLGKG